MSEGTSVRIGNEVRKIDPEDLPDRLFREAWAFSGQAIVVNMDRAREIHRDRLRAIRAPLFEPLDVEVTRALVSGDSGAAAAAEAKRQALRDVTDDVRLLAAPTPEALAALDIETLLAE